MKIPINLPFVQQDPILPDFLHTKEQLHSRNRS